MEADLQALLTKADLENGLERLHKGLREDLREEFRVIHAKLDRLGGKFDRITLEVRWGFGFLIALTIAINLVPHLL